MVTYAEQITWSGAGYVQSFGFGNYGDTKVPKGDIFCFVRTR